MNEEGVKNHIWIITSELEEKIEDVVEPLVEVLNEKNELCEMVETEIGAEDREE